MPRGNVAYLVRQHRSEFAIVRELQQTGGDVDVSARQRQAVDFAALDHVEFVKQVRPRTHARDTLAKPFDAIKADVSKTEFLRRLSMQLRAELYLIALIQQSGV